MLRRPMIALAAAMILFVAACSDSGPSASAYFEGLGAAVQSAADRTSAADSEAPAGATLEQRKAIIGDALEEFRTILDDLLAGLDDLDPPENARRLHGLFIDAERDLGAQFDAYRDRLLAADSIEAFGDAQQDTELLDAAGALADLCLDMEDAASEHGILLELGCSNP